MRPVAVNEMDVARAKPRGLNRGATIALAVGLLVVVASAALYSLTRSGGGIVVERASVVTDIVRRGDLDRSISASGTLAPQEVHIVAAVEPGVV